VTTRPFALILLGALMVACADPTTPAPNARLAPLLQPSGDVTTEVIPNEYNVVLRDGVTNVGGEADLAQRQGAEVLARWEHALKGFAARAGASALLEIRRNPAVQFVSPNARVRASGQEQCSPYSACGWGLDRIDQSATPLDGLYNYPSNLASNVTVYILDTGIRTTNTDFGGRASWGRDFIDGSNQDCNGHGTHVASTATGTKYGVAKGAKAVAVRVLDCSGNGTYTQVISGINWVTANAVKPAVANMSLGGPPDAATDNAVAASIASGIVYAVAAGNSAANACNYTPSRVAAAITVGATGKYGGGLPPTPLDVQSSYSNYGSCLDLYAPGTNIRAAWNTGDAATNTISGTSMASPHVAGAAALYLAQHPTATSAEVRDALVNNAIAGALSSLGTGSPNRLLNVAFLNGATSNQPPTANFSISCIVNVSCTLDATSSTDDHGIVSYAWKSSDPARGNRTGSVITRVYLPAGSNTWNETLTVTDGNGATNPITKTVTIPTTTTDQPPVASFSISCSASTHSCVLNASSSTDDHGIVSYEWHNSDPNRPDRTGVSITRYHSTEHSDTFQETLTVTDTIGQKTSITKTVTIP
jgi:subtilisin family serine protease